MAYTFLYWLPNYIHVMYKVPMLIKTIQFTDRLMQSKLGFWQIFLMSAELSEESHVESCQIKQVRGRDDKYFILPGKPATTCGIMLVMAVPSLFIYQALVKDW